METNSFDDKIARLKELKELLESGALTAAEFDREKQKVLDANESPEPVVLEVPRVSPKKSKSNLWAGILAGCLLAAVLALVFILLHNRKPTAKPPKAVAATAQPVREEPSAPVAPAVPRVYSCAYDGFVNMRRQPSYSAEKVGQFKNGPEGAILLEDLGTWVKIDVNGIVGYVASKYVQGTPTLAYTGSVDVNWLEGVWQGSENSDYAFLNIYNNGTYDWYLEVAGQQGTWILQNNEIKFTLVCEDEGFGNGTVFTETLPINQAAKKLGDYQRLPLYSEREIDYHRGPGAYTKAEFRQAGKGNLQLVEAALSRR